MVANPAPIGVLERASGCESAAGPRQGSGAAEDGILGTVASVTPKVHLPGAFGTVAHHAARAFFSIVPTFQTRVDSALAHDRAG